MLVAQSTDGGQTFGAPVTLDDSTINPIVSDDRALFDWLWPGA